MIREARINEMGGLVVELENGAMLTLPHPEARGMYHGPWSDEGQGGRVRILLEEDHPLQALLEEIYAQLKGKQ